MNFLDWLIERSHHIRVFGKRYHPYFIAADCGILLSLAAAYVLTTHFQGISFLRFVFVYGLMIALYQLFLVFKSRVLKMPSRSFLQDTVLFLLPMYAIVSLAAGFPLRLAFDLTGVIFPLYGCLARVGCLLGGCCYGLACERGVLYRSEIFEPVSGCRSFRPGENPHTRVFPIQLVESAGLLAIGILVFRMLWLQDEPRGLAMPFFLLCYSMFRFTLDFFRRSSARPRIGSFSEAQVYSFVVAALSAGMLAVLTRAA